MPRRKSSCGSSHSNFFRVNEQGNIETAIPGYLEYEKCVKCEVDLILTKHKIRIEAKTKQLNKLNEKK